MQNTTATPKHQVHRPIAFVRWAAYLHARRLAGIMKEEGAFRVTVDQAAARQMFIGAVNGAPSLGLQPATYSAISSILWSSADAEAYGDEGFLILTANAVQPGASQAALQLWLPLSPVRMIDMLDQALRKAGKLDLYAVSFNAGTGAIDPSSLFSVGYRR